MTDQVDQLDAELIYSIPFQRNLLHMYATNCKFAASYGDLIKSSYFESTAMQTLFIIIKDYVTAYEKEITEDELFVSLAERIETHGVGDVTARELKQEAKSLINTVVMDEKFIIDRLVNFARRQELKNALIKSVDVLENPTGSYDNVLAMINTAVSIGSGNDEGLIFESLFDMTKIYADKYNEKTLLQTGLPTWDKYLGGGLGPGELHVILAPPKNGKCLKFDTPIQCLNSEIKTIREVVENKVSHVLALDFDDMKIKPHKVLDWIYSGILNTKRLTTSVGFSLNLTSNHPLLTHQGWRPVSELKVGDRIACYLDADICFVEIKSIEDSGLHPCYDIEVEKNHNFIANNIISHNSTIGVSIGANVLKQFARLGVNKGVYHVSGELAKEDILVKYAQNLSGMTINEITKTSSEEYLERMEKYRDVKANLFVQNWIEGTTNLNSIRAWITKLRLKFGVDPGLIVVDYDDTFLPSTGVSDSMYDNGGQVYSDMIGLAGYFRCPVLSFSQCQRESWNLPGEGKLIDSSHLAHSAKKAHKCFSISSLNFTKEGDEGILYVDIVRRGVSFQKIKIKKDLSRCTFFEI